MERFQQFLWDLGELIGLPLHIDKNHACKLLLEEKFTLQLEMSRDQESLLAIAIITELPPGAFLEKVLKETLKVNSIYHPFGIFGYIKKTNALTLHQYIDIEYKATDDVMKCLTLLAQEAENWRHAIEINQIPPPHHFKPSSIPPTFMDR